jgi:hypothetical protein
VNVISAVASPSRTPVALMCHPEPAALAAKSIATLIDQSIVYKKGMDSKTRNMAEARNRHP